MTSELLTEINVQNRSLYAS